MGDRILKFLIVLLSLLPGLTLGDDNNRFLSPRPDRSLTPDFPVWKKGEIQTIEWETDMVVSNLSIWQENVAPDPKGATNGPIIFDLSAIMLSQPVPTKFEWVVQPYGFNLEKSNLFFFWVNHGGPKTFVSTYFNISDDSSSTTSSPSSSSTNTASTASGTSADSTALPNEGKDNDASPSSSSSSEDSTTKVALGVGLGIGIPLMGILGFIAFMLFRRSQTQETTQIPQSLQYSQMPSDNKTPEHFGSPLQELDASARTPELDTTSRRTELSIHNNNN